MYVYLDNYEWQCNKSSRHRNTTQLKPLKQCNATYAVSTTVHPLAEFKFSTEGSLAAPLSGLRRVAFLPGWGTWMLVPGMQQSGDRWQRGKRKYNYNFYRLESHDQDLLSNPSLDIPTRGRIPRKPGGEDFH